MKIEEENLKENLIDCKKLIETHRDDLARTEIRFRQLNDNRRLFQCQNDLKVKEKQLNQLEEQTQGLKFAEKNKQTKHFSFNVSTTKLDFQIGFVDARREKSSFESGRFDQRKTHRISASLHFGTTTQRTSRRNRPGTFEERAPTIFETFHSAISRRNRFSGSRTFLQSSRPDHHDLSHRENETTQSNHS